LCGWTEGRDWGPVGHKKAGPMADHVGWKSWGTKTMREGTPPRIKEVTEGVCENEPITKNFGRVFKKEGVPVMGYSIGQ